MRLQGWVRHEWIEAFGAFAHEHHRILSLMRVQNPRSWAIGAATAEFEPGRIQSRRLAFNDVDDIEVGYDQGWSDGLPVVPPRPPVCTECCQEPRDNRTKLSAVSHPITVFVPLKNCRECCAGGCLPEYLPVVIAAVEAALEEPFCMHGLLATTYFSGPMVVVNGPYSGAIGMNCGGNALGQGNRANATIGRALQLVIRNVGGGKPGVSIDLP